MESEINFKIENVGPVANANIKIGKINVVGGKNSTGKSTSSKILYCFLRANSSNRQDLAIESLFTEIRRFDFLLGRYLPEEELESLRMSRREVNTHDFEDLVRYYEEMKLIFYETNEISFPYLDEESNNTIKSLINKNFHKNFKVYGYSKKPFLVFLPKNPFSTYSSSKGQGLYLFFVGGWCVAVLLCMIFDEIIILIY